MVLLDSERTVYQANCLKIDERTGQIHPTYDLVNVTPLPRQKNPPLIPLSTSSIKLAADIYEGRLPSYPTVENAVDQAVGIALHSLMLVFSHLAEIRTHTIDQLMHENSSPPNRSTYLQQYKQWYPRYIGASVDHHSPNLRAKTRKWLVDLLSQPRLQLLPSSYESKNSIKTLAQLVATSLLDHVTSHPPFRNSKPLKFIELDGVPIMDAEAVQYAWDNQQSADQIIVTAEGLASRLLQNGHTKIKNRTTNYYELRTHALIPIETHTYGRRLLLTTSEFDWAQLQYDEEGGLSYIAKMVITDYKTAKFSLRPHSLAEQMSQLITASAAHNLRNNHQLFIQDASTMLHGNLGPILPRKLPQINYVSFTDLTTFVDITKLFGSTWTYGPVPLINPNAHLVAQVADLVDFILSNPKLYHDYFPQLFWHSYTR